MTTRRTIIATALVAAFVPGAGALTFAADPLQHPAGTDATQGKSKATPIAGAVQIALAMNERGRYFNHPGRKPLR